MTYVLIGGLKAWHVWYIIGNSKEMTSLTRALAGFFMPKGNPPLNWHSLLKCLIPVVSWRLAVWLSRKGTGCLVPPNKANLPQT